MARLIDVYPYRHQDNRIEFLIFKRSDDVIYAGQWRMIGGAVQDQEKAYEAALRELREEAGQSPKQFWAIPSVNHFYDHKSDRVYSIPAFAAQLPVDSNIRLNHEHVAYQWVKRQEVSEFISWPEQLRLMNIAANIINNKKIQDEWIIPIG